MSQSIFSSSQHPSNLQYPFGNPNKETNLQDIQSYHSITVDNKKLTYFDEPIDPTSFRQGQTSTKKKHPLPPTYPYQNVKKLKQSISTVRASSNGASQNQKNTHNMIHYQNNNQSRVIGVNDNNSVHSVDSFHTANNEFESICYEEGDFEQVMKQMQQQKQGNIQFEQEQLDARGEYEGIMHSKVKDEPRYEQRDLENKENKSEWNSIKAAGKDDNKQSTSNRTNTVAINKGEIVKGVVMQQSQALNQIELQDLQDIQKPQESEQKSIQNYSVCEVEPNLQVCQLQPNLNHHHSKKQSPSNLRDSQNPYQNQQNQLQHQPQYQQQQQYQSQQHQHPSAQQQDNQNQIQISHIQNALNQSQLIDQQILSLTKQLQSLHSQSMIYQNPNPQQFRQKQQFLAQKYQAIQTRLEQLKQHQKNFTSQLSSMQQLVNKTQTNNKYLQKQLQFFKQKSQHFQSQQKLIQQQKQQQQLTKSKQLSSSRAHSLSLNESKLKPKTYHIKPKTPNNHSLQSQRYKQLTFHFSSQQNLTAEDTWHDLEIDTQNQPAQYKLVYAFQHQNTILALRLIDLITNQSSRSSSWHSKKSSAQTSIVKKNYQYLIDFAHHKYSTQQDKIKALTKELVIHLNHEQYQCKQFTKKIQVFVMISEEETFVDLVKLVPLPNPLVFYIQNRFSFLGKANINSAPDKHQNNDQNLHNQIQHKTNGKDKGKNMFNVSSIKTNLPNLTKFMKTYVIKIEQMADVESIQKLINLNWVTNTQTQQIKYFTIKSQIKDKQKPSESNSKQIRTQLFYVKIQDCTLKTGPQYQPLDAKHRYSLVFRVGSTYDNQILLDLIQFLTFLTVY